MLKVLRAQDGTSAQEHVDGATVDLVDGADDALVELGDDFGFNETTSFFQDAKTYNPTTGQDE